MLPLPGTLSLSPVDVVRLIYYYRENAIPKSHLGNRGIEGVFDVTIEIAEIFVINNLSVEHHLRQLVNSFDVCDQLVCAGRTTH
jgi:hypothetical protein